MGVLQGLAARANVMPALGQVAWQGMKERVEAEAQPNPKQHDETSKMHNAAAAYAVLRQHLSAEHC